jgi:hypothetical protein
MTSKNSKVVYLQCFTLVRLVSTAPHILNTRNGFHEKIKKVAAEMKFINSEFNEVDLHSLIIQRYINRTLIISITVA